MPDIRISLTDKTIAQLPAPKAALGKLEIQLPLYPRKQTQLGNRGTSEKCQRATSEARTARWRAATSPSYFVVTVRLPL
jgi:hypothetical protein